MNGKERKGGNMREIEFKAIFKRGRNTLKIEAGNYKTMYYKTAFDDNYFEYPFGWILLAQDLQYTEHKDKNGIKIYEGDLLYNQSMEIISYVEYRKGLITSSFHYWTYKNKKKNTLRYLGSGYYPENYSEHIKYYEKIGNRYKNKELLTCKKQV